MTPELMAAYLKVLREGGVASARFVLNGEAEVAVVFAPEAGLPTPPGDELTPGGWKGPARLDRDPMDDERSVP